MGAARGEIGSRQLGQLHPPIGDSGGLDKVSAISQRSSSQRVQGCSQRGTLAEDVSSVVRYLQFVSRGGHRATRKDDQADGRRP